MNLAGCIYIFVFHTHTYTYICIVFHTHRLYIYIYSGKSNKKETLSSQEWQRPGKGLREAVWKERGKEREGESDAISISIKKCLKGKKINTFYKERLWELLRK